MEKIKKQNEVTMGGKRVSILCPIYGVEAFIERCAYSLFNQTYENIDYVFVDDASKDHSIDLLRKVIKQYPKREQQVHIITHETNRGLSAARNTALEHAIGDYLIHVDSDDFLELDAIRLCVNKIERTKADVIMFGYNVVNGKHCLKKILPNFFGNKTRYINALLLKKEPASMWNKFYNTQFYLNTGIRSVEGLNQGEDYAVVPRLLYHAHRISFLQKYLYNYNVGNMHSHMKNITEKSIKDMVQADSILSTFFSSHKDAIEYNEGLMSLNVRSKLFFIKEGKKGCYPLIRKYYGDCIENKSLLSVSDKILLWLFEHRLYAVLFMLVQFGIKMRKG